MTGLFLGIVLVQLAYSFQASINASHYNYWKKIINNFILYPNEGNAVEVTMTSGGGAKASPSKKPPCDFKDF